MSVRASVLASMAVSTAAVVGPLPLQALHLQAAHQQADAEALGRHLQHCRAGRGRWFRAALWAERMHQRLAPRFVTTLVGATAALLLLVTAAGGH